MNTAKQKAYILPSQFPERCMCAYGEDRYGIWSEIEIFGVVQRFRWIPPGEFTMGSPEDEPERRDNETQHIVTLTQGFWLADTACTQQLWEAVMGENPGKFKGKNRPVESVSWGDCENFIQRVNRENPELSLSFPTEAQWEYACRAGTMTPFSFGDNITPEEVNYHGEYPYAGGKKGINRRETVDVKSLPVNPWGLYEMHGNVWEGCADWYGEHSADAVTNPQGPDAGVLRVLRGGSWFDFGGYCRSAYRDLSRPVNRHSSIGFRLSRGPIAFRQEAEPHSEETEVAGNATGDATSGAK